MIYMFFKKNINQIINTKYRYVDIIYLKIILLQIKQTTCFIYFLSLQ